MRHECCKKCDGNRVGKPPWYHCSCECHESSPEHKFDAVGIAGERIEAGNFVIIGKDSLVYGVDNPKKES